MKTSILKLLQIFLAPFSSSSSSSSPSSSSIPEHSHSTSGYQHTPSGTAELLYSQCNSTTAGASDQWRIVVSRSWQVLGPFQIGTREAEWGSDPLKLYAPGGFQNLTYTHPTDPSDKINFKSSLTVNGTVRWGLSRFVYDQDIPGDSDGNDDSHARAYVYDEDINDTSPGYKSTTAAPAGILSGKITIEFTNSSTTNNPNVINWEYLRDIYGWAGTQFQGWVRGEILICPPSSPSPSLSSSSHTPPPHPDPDSLPLLLTISPTLEFFVNNTSHFGGDMYSYSRAPQIVHLQPGVAYPLDIRVTHDIRAFGGRVPPVIDIFVKAEVSGNGDGGGLGIDEGKAVVPDVVVNDGGGEVDSGKGKKMLAGDGWLSFPVRNEREEGWIEVLGVEAGESDNNDDISTKIIFKKDNDPLFRLAPGQSRPLKVRIADFSSNATTIPLIVQYRVQGETEIQHRSSSLKFKKAKSLYEPHIFTYLHPSGIVSYATLRPPSRNATCGGAGLPILLSLHGAGVDVRWDFAQNVYSKMPDLCAWLLIPQGVTLWSGDDWHLWGWADVEAAIEAIPGWMRSIGWQGEGADLDKWVVTGHSNGGQGTWYALTHWSDKIIAATPLSGYLSIQAYVPYQMWHEADPKKSALVLASTNSYRHELLVDNIVGTPIMQGHGGLDDNVPNFHSRRMRFLAQEAGWETEYIEFPDQGHWWTGAMTDGRLSAFLNRHINEKPMIPELPEKFAIVVANPADMGPRGGIVVEQLDASDRLGKMSVERANSSTWLITTTNIRRWRFGKQRPGLACPTKILLDSRPFSISDGKEMFVMSTSGKWKVVRSESWRKRERNGRQLGALDAFLNTKDHFTIVLPPPSERKAHHKELAVEIANNLFQYYAADSNIVEDIKHVTGEGNVILIDPRNHSKRHEQSKVDFGISIHDGTISIRDTTGRRKTFHEQGLGAIFLKPLGIDRLMLVVWGVDEEGLRAAARLVPLRTGVGQPNFAVLGREAGWKGVGGVLAMGMFDSDWQVASGQL